MFVLILLFVFSWRWVETCPFTNQHNALFLDYEPTPIIYLWIYRSIDYLKALLGIDHPLLSWDPHLQTRTPGEVLLVSAMAGCGPGAECLEGRSAGIPIWWGAKTVIWKWTIQNNFAVELSVIWNWKGDCATKEATTWRFARMGKQECKYGKNKLNFFFVSYIWRGLFTKGS